MDKSAFQGSNSSLNDHVTAKAHQNLFIGTSSWKYPGWCGSVYDESKYLTRNKFSEAKFERECLAEYAEMFSTVCVDAGYYKFPNEAYLQKLTSQVSLGFLFGFKVTDDITLKTFPNLPRFGLKAGKPNPDFLNAELFEEFFLQPCARYASHIGVLMFEFTQFHPSDFEHGRDFVSALDKFLASLPKRWQYGVEIRNKAFLHPDYFACLRSHDVAHVFNSWSRMPSVTDQLAMEDSVTTDFVAARFLLKPGRSYTQAVEGFSPYNSIKEVNDEARKAGKALIVKAKEGKRKSFIFVNNRLEGHAPSTITAMLD